jgi:ribosome-binding factor A
MPQGRTHHRLERINSMLQAEISDIIRMELKDPRVGFVSVIRVDSSPDLRHARVRVSVMGGDDEKKQTMEGLHRAGPFIRETILHRQNIKRIPHLEFLLDENIEYSIHISEVLEKLKDPSDG